MCATTADVAEAAAAAAREAAATAAEKAAEDARAKAQTEAVAARSAKRLDQAIAEAKAAGWTSLPELKAAQLELERDESALALRVANRAVCA